MNNQIQKNARVAVLALLRGKRILTISISRSVDSTSEAVSTICSHIGCPSSSDCLMVEDWFGFVLKASSTFLLCFTANKEASYQLGNDTLSTNDSMGLVPAIIFNSGITGITLKKKIQIIQK